MSSNSPHQFNELQSSLTVVRKLQSSASTSILLMVLGIAVVVGSFIYSITRLRPLEHKITQRQLELKAIEEEFRVLSDKNDELRHDTENAQAQLETTRKEVNSALVNLEEIRNSPLPDTAKNVIADAIAKILDAQNIVRRVETELAPTKQTASPESDISRSQAISNLFSDQPAVRIKAYNVIMDNYSTDPALIPELLSYARANTNNENGIYNTLVVLSHLNRDQLRPHVTDIRAFAKEVEPIGPKINQRVDKLLSRLPT